MAQGTRPAQVQRLLLERSGCWEPVEGQIDFGHRSRSRSRTKRYRASQRDGQPSRESNWPTY
jgi:hypothetical protein